MSEEEKKNVIAIVNCIRRLRFDADNMTQRELADAVGVTRQTIIAIENRRHSPSLEIAFRIADVFEKPLEEVFRRAENTAMNGKPIEQDNSLEISRDAS